MPVLYRDYRPQDFSEIINQEHVKKTLQNAVAGGSFAHAYLFTGPRGTGKTSIARIFARAINCLKQKNGEPCNECAVCKQFLDGTSLDLTEIDAASNTGVENVRDIIEHLKFSPAQAKYKVFIIDEVHMLSKGAFNALLKTLEEPPAHAIFILATTEVHKVPATVVSRTQRFDFKKIEHKALVAHLKEIAKKEKIVIDEQSLHLVVNASEGSVRDALSVLDKLASVGEIDIGTAEKLLGVANMTACQDFLDLLYGKNAPAALDFLQNLFEMGADPVQFNKDFLEYLRKVLMVANGANVDFALNDDHYSKLAKQAKAVGINQLLYVIRLFLRANKDFETSPSAELPLEIATAEICLNVPASATAGEVKVVNAREVKMEEARAREVKAGEAKAGDATVDKPTVTETAKDPVVKGNTNRAHSSAEKEVSLDEVLSAWPQILEKIKNTQSTLLAILKNVQVESINNNRLILVSNYKFHKDSLDNKKNKDVLLKIFSEQFNTPVSVEIIVKASVKPKTVDTSSAAMEMFGGEIV